MSNKLMEAERLAAARRLLESTMSDPCVTVPLDQIEQRIAAAAKECSELGAQNIVVAVELMARAHATLGGADIALARVWALDFVARIFQATADVLAKDEPPKFVHLPPAGRA